MTHPGTWQKLLKKTAREKGILSDPNPKRGKTLEEDTVQRVKEFYLSESVSRQVPGKKNTVSVKILHPSGPARSFKYPEKPDNLIVSVHDILSVVETKTSTGRVYTVTQSDQSAASQLLEKNIAERSSSGSGIFFSYPKLYAKFQQNL